MQKTNIGGLIDNPPKPYSDVVFHMPVSNIYPLSFYIRPLIGVSFCKRNACYYITIRNKVSVPLSGLVSTNFCHLNGFIAAVNVSVPLSGLVSVNCEKVIPVIYRTMSFRPLIGVSFCKLFLCNNKII